MIAEMVAAPPYGEQQMILLPPGASVLVMPGEGHVFSLDGALWWRFEGPAPAVMFEGTAARSSWLRTTRPELIGVLPAGARL